MLSQEEIRIKAGLDYSKVTAGLTDIRGQVFKLAEDVPKKLSGLLKANLYVAAASLISEALPTWDEIWNRIYNTGPDAMRRSEESNKNIRNLIDAQRKAAQDLEDTKKDITFGNADEQNKVFLLMKDDAALDDEQKKIQERIAGFKKFGKEMKESMGDAYNGSDTQAYVVGGITKAETDLLKNQKSRAEIGDKIGDLRKKMAEKVVPTEDPKPVTPPAAAPARKLTYAETVAESKAKWQAHIDRINGKRPSSPQSAPTGSAENPLMVVIQDVK